MPFQFEESGQSSLKGQLASWFCPPYQQRGHHQTDDSGVEQPSKKKKVYCSKFFKIFSHKPLAAQDRSDHKQSFLPFLLLSPAVAQTPLQPPELGDIVFLERGEAAVFSLLKSQRNHSEKTMMVWSQETSSFCSEKLVSWMGS